MSGEVTVPPPQEYPASTTQLELHPSTVESVFPSSQASVECFLPSPHFTSQLYLSELWDSPVVEQSVHVPGLENVPLEQP